MLMIKLSQLFFSNARKQEKSPREMREWGRLSIIYTDERVKNLLFSHNQQVAGRGT